MNILGTNIISSLGFTTDENFENVKQGVSGIKYYDAGVFDVPEGFMASLVDKERLNAQFEFLGKAATSFGDYTNLEKAAILSVVDANKEAAIDLANSRTLFVLSTTKGNVHLLNHNSQPQVPNPQLYLWHSAQQISRFFGNTNTPIVVSNACISGASAQITAMRYIESGEYDHAVVVGADFLSKFIISGFQSFKALSPEPCKPFDQLRSGLNLGEAAATMIMGNTPETSSSSIKTVHIAGGAVRNDATHISAPSRIGEGSYRALRYLITKYSLSDTDIAFINAHGTATPYNDAMEAVAIDRAGLATVPVFSLKPLFGHTLGAAGVVESIITMKALSENLVLKSLNFNEQNFEIPINISTKNQQTDKKYALKMLSGFGGCNAVLLFEKETLK